jgi:biopolymer transport protein ExbD
MAAGPSKGIKNEINITPLVDVVLVLLIIFMVITPMLQRGKSVTLPKAQNIEKRNSDSDPLILSVTPDKKMYLENDQFDPEGLENKIREELEAMPGRRILLKGDSTLQVSDVRKAMEIARKAKAKSISLGVEEQKE